MVKTMATLEVITHEYVDLGLPSGLLWATCNVGADTPEAYGDYFAWGETEPKNTYNLSTYQYANGTFDDPQLTKYCNNPSYGYNGFTDNLTTLLQSSSNSALVGMRQPSPQLAVAASSSGNKVVKLSVKPL